MIKQILTFYLVLNNLYIKERLLSSSLVVFMHALWSRLYQDSIQRSKTTELCLRTLNPARSLLVTPDKSHMWIQQQNLWSCMQSHDWSERFWWYGGETSHRSRRWWRFWWCISNMCEYIWCGDSPAVCCMCDQTNMDSWTDSQETLWIVYVKGDIPSACGSGWLEGPE